MSAKRNRKRFARRCLPQTLVRAGTVGLAGCGAVLPEDAADGQSGEGDDTTNALPRFCEIQVLTSADADPYRFDVTVTVGRDGETVYDDNPRGTTRRTRPVSLASRVVRHTPRSSRRTGLRPGCGVVPPMLPETRRTTPRVHCASLTRVANLTETGLTAQYGNIFDDWCRGCL